MTILKLYKLGRSAMQRFIEWVKPKPETQALQEFQAEGDDLEARLNAKLDDDRVRQRITDARVRNLRRLP